MSASRPRRHVRFEEYAAHGLADARADEKPQSASRGRSAGAMEERNSSLPRHSAATSHRQHDAYMDAFDDAYEDLVGKNGGKPDAAPSDMARETEQTAKLPKASAVREQEVAPPSALHQLSGAWLSGPASPEGSVHRVSAQPIMCMSLSPDEHELVVGSSDHALYSIPVSASQASGRGARSATGAGRMRTLYTKKFGHTEWVTCSMYLSDNRIVSGGMDSKLCLWDATGVKCEDLTGHAGSITFVRDLKNDFVLSASYDKTVRVWNVGRKASSRQREISTIKVGSAPILDGSVLTGGGTRSIITGDRDGCVHIVNLDEEKISRKIAGAHKGHTTSVLASKVDESALCFSGGQDGTVRVWDLRQKNSTPAHALELHIHRKTGKAGAVGFLLEPDGDPNTLITAGADGTIKVLDKRKSFKTLFNLTEHLDFIYAMHVRGQLCFSGAGNGMLHVHDWKSGKLLYGLGANKAAVRAIETTSSHLIASGDDGSVMMYDMV